MIIYGTKGVEKTIRSGKFLCPSCGGERQYRLVEVNKYFTLYFIPLFSVGRIGSYVECLYCKNTFKRNVLRLGRKRPTSPKNVEENIEKNAEEKIEAQYIEAIKNVMLLIMMADGVIDDDEVKMIRAIFLQLSGKHLEAEEIKSAGERIIRDQKNLASYLKVIYPTLNLQGKNKVLQAAMEVACADGEFQLEEQQLVYMLINVLQIPLENANNTIQKYFEINIDSLAFLCPACNHPTFIKHRFQPVGKKKKCKTCHKIYQLSSATLQKARLASSQKIVQKNTEPTRSTATKNLQQSSATSTILDYKIHCNVEDIVGKQITIEKTVYIIEKFVTQRSFYNIFSIKNAQSGLILSTAGICIHPLETPECEDCYQRDIDGANNLRSAGIAYVPFILYKAHGALIKIQPHFQNEESTENQNLNSQAAHFFNEKKYTEAMAVFDQILQKNPFHTDALANKANCLMNLDDLDKALEFAAKACQIEPLIPSYAMVAAHSFAYQGILGNALLSLDSIVEKIKDDHDAALSYVRFACNFDIAYFFKDRVLKIYELFQNYDDFQKIKSDMEASFTRSKEYVKYVQHAAKLQHQKNWAQAAEVCQKSFELSTNNFTARLNYYICLYHLGKYKEIKDEAGYLLRVMRKSAFNYSCILMVLANAYEQDWQEAKKYFTLLLSLAKSWGLPLGHPVDLPSVPTIVDVFGKQDIEDKSAKVIMNALNGILQNTQLSQEEHQQTIHLLDLYQQREKIMYK